MFQAKNLLFPKKVAFFIASNGIVKKNDFCEFNIYTNENNVMKDLYSLSLCDYIMGPPSTFSMWASWFGKKPLRILDFNDEQIKLEEFEIIKSQNTFVSGRIWNHK